MRRPVVAGLAAVLVLLVLAAPFLHVSFTGADANILLPALALVAKSLGVKPYYQRWDSHVGH